MKKAFLFFVLTLGVNNSYSQDFIRTTYIRIDNSSLIKENYDILYEPESQIIGIVDLNYENIKVWKYGPVELKSTSYEQGLYIESYSPTIEKLLNTSPNAKKYLFKFAYDKKGGKPVLVTEISYTSKSNYQVKLYYTDYYFELGSKR